MTAADGTPRSSMELEPPNEPEERRTSAGAPREGRHGDRRGQDASPSEVATPKQKERVRASSTRTAPK
jgi:hypothetical protein